MAAVAALIAVWCEKTDTSCRRLTAQDHAERSEHVRFSTLDQPKQNIAKKIELALAK
jgi:hypothetical protein